MKFSQIKRLPECNYRIDQSLVSIKDWLNRMSERTKNGLGGLDLNPDYQRGYVWSEYQKTSYIEWLLKGGKSGTELFFNCSTWQTSYSTPLELVDGKQRLSAALDFLDNKIKAFGYYMNEFEDKLRYSTASFSINIARLQSRKEVIQWYIDMNTGGSAHTEEDLKPAYKVLSLVRD